MMLTIIAAVAVLVLAVWIGYVHFRTREAFTAVGRDMDDVEQRLITMERRK